MMQLNSDQVRRIRRLSLTPLIDVVFLLLIFFMLSSTFLKFTKVPVNSAVSSGSGKINKDNVVILFVKADGVVQLNERIVEAGKLTDELNELYGKRIEHVIIKAEDKAVTQDVITLLQQARRSKIKNIMLAR